MSIYKEIQKIGEREYLNSINEFKLNDEYVAALMGSQLQLHTLNESAIEGRESILFPQAEHNEGKVTNFNLTKEYLIMATDAGQLSHFNVDEWQFLNKYKHTVGIKKIFAESYGMSVIFIDNNSEGYIYNPINDTIIKIEGISPTTQGVLWETYEPNKWIFVSFDGTTIKTFVYSKYSMSGANCILIAETNQPYSSLPLLLFKGVVVFLDAGGKILQLKLASHTHDVNLDEMKPEELIDGLRKNYMLKLYDEAYFFAQRVQDKLELLSFARHTLAHLDVEYAIKVFRLCGQADMVFALNSIKVIHL